MFINRLCLGLLSLLVITAPAPAQRVIEVTEDIDFDRPESWAMKYFNSASLLTPIGPPEVRKAWSVDVGVELTQIPHLDTAQRTVGFEGIKEEDLNKLPVLVRPRVTLGLPFRFSLEASYLPPVTVEGMKPSLFSLALERNLVDGERWSLGLRAHGQVGDIEGDFTCGDEEASFPPGSPQNAFGCRSRSNDTATLEHLGLYLGAGYRLRSWRRSELHFGGFINHFDQEFQVNAATFGVIDRTLLRSDGDTWGILAGITVPTTKRTRLGIELFYSPLEVVRPPATSSETDGLLNIRTVLRYRFHED